MARPRFEQVINHDRHVRINSQSLYKYGSSYRLDQNELDMTWSLAEHKQQGFASVCCLIFTVNEIGLFQPLPNQIVYIGQQILSSILNELIYKMSIPYFIHKSAP